MACLCETLRDKRDHRRGAEQADVDARRAELRRVAADGEVAGRDELAARRSRRPLDGGDDGLRQRDDALHQRGAALQDALIDGPAAVGVAAVGGEFLQVVAGAEHRPLGGDHHRPDARIRRDGVQLGVQRADEPFRQGVARLRPVEGEDRDRGLRPGAAASGRRRRVAPSA